MYNNGGCIYRYRKSCEHVKAVFFATLFMPVAVTFCNIQTIHIPLEVMLYITVDRSLIASNSGNDFITHRCNEQSKTRY